MLKSFNAPLATAAVSVGAVVAAAIVAGFMVFLSGVPEVKAEPQVEIAVQQPHAKGDRLAILVKGSACSSLGWPHYERNCQYDLRRPADEMRTVRVVALR